MDRVSLLKRLMELHPGWHSSVHVTYWSHQEVRVQLSTHPPGLRQGCWAIFTHMRSEGCSPEALAASEQLALDLALQLAEADEWDKPVPEPTLDTVLAG